MNSLLKTVCSCWKLLRVGWHIVTGLLVVAFVFPGLSARQKEQRIGAWSLALLGLMAVKLAISGKPPTRGPVLLAANHLSWLDIVVIQAACPARFVAKAEVRKWPVLGRLAAATGTLFIVRQSRSDAVRVVHLMTAHLQGDEVLAIFPEGTSSDGTTLLPFHANLFQAAISASAPVLPVALYFSEDATGIRSLAPCYIGEDTMLDSIWCTLQAPSLCAHISFGEPQHANGRNRRRMAVEIRDAVAQLRSRPPESCAWSSRKVEETGCQFRRA